MSAAYGGKLWINGEFVISQRIPKKNGLKVSERNFDNKCKHEGEKLAQLTTPTTLQAYRNLSTEEKIERLKQVKALDQDKELTTQQPEPKISELQKTIQEWENNAQTDTDGGEAKRDPLALSSVQICHRQLEGSASVLTPVRPVRARRGSNGISSHSKRMIRATCFKMTKTHGRKRLGFATFTLPQLDLIYMEALALNWSEIVRKFLQKYRRRLADLNAPTEYVGVTEIQTKRYNDFGYVCPHLHLVYTADATGKGDFYIDRHWMQEAWDSTLIQQLNHAMKKGTLETAELPVIHARIDCQKVKKDAGAYLSKYLSKGGEIIAKIALESPELLPKSWLYVADALRKSVLNGIEDIAPGAVRAIHSSLNELIEEENILYLRPGSRNSPINYDYYEGEFEIPPRAGDDRPPLKLWFAVGRFSTSGLKWVKNWKDA